jgi:hypothetical protein
MCVTASNCPPVEEVMAELEQWLRQEVAPLVAAGVNWKAVINGRGADDWSYVLEKHGGRRVNGARTGQGKRPAGNDVG